MTARSHTRSCRLCVLACVLAAAASTLFSEGFICPHKPGTLPVQHLHESVKAAKAKALQVNGQATPRSSLRLLISLLGLMTVVDAAHAAPIQFNAQLAGDLSEAQKRKIKEYLEQQKGKPAADVVVGERPLKVYVKPTEQEMTPGTPEFKARVAKVSPELGDRLIEPEKAAEMMKAGAVLVDVRTRDQVWEQSQGELPKEARLVPLDDWVGSMPPPLMRGKKIILSCFLGQKSVLAWEALRAQFADAYVLHGGVKAWKAAGLPTRML